MIELRKAALRGTTCAGLSQSRHSFSCADYFDPAHPGFGALRVLNEDTLAPAARLPVQRRANMEILTWVLDGALCLREDENGEVRLAVGTLHVLSAGRGIQRQEMNASPTQPARTLQLWIQSNRVNAEPESSRREFDARAARVLLASADGRDGSLRLRSDVDLQVLRLDVDECRAYALAQGRRCWLQVTHGALSCNGIALTAGDGAGIRDEQQVLLHATSVAEVLLVDLPD